MQSIKNLLKKSKLIRTSYLYTRELKWLICGYFYDFLRFFKHGGWRRRIKNIDERNYYVMFLYHKMEKSLSYVNRNPKSGWKDALELTNIVKFAYLSQDYGYHDIAAKQVISKFINLPENINDPRTDKIKNILIDVDFNSPDTHGTLKKSKNELQKGKLDNPEDFFFSRFSLREFSEKKVELDTINHAINLAKKTPSVCNRQHWHVYHTDNNEIRDLALELQNGNRGFGHKIPNLLIITSDQKAFFTTNEKNQGWIDGGMYLMSLIYALHSLGVSSCALNWSQTPKIDKKLRSRLNINDSHSIICMLAIGYPQDTNIVCASARVPQEYFVTELKKRANKS